jgi:hypothetical protein
MTNDERRTTNDEFLANGHEIELLVMQMDIRLQRQRPSER